MATVESSPAISWAKQTDKRISKMTDPGQLTALAAQAEQRASQPGLLPLDRAELSLTATAAYGRLAQLHVNSSQNGEKGFKELQQAVAAAPDAADVAASYGRALLIISKLNWLFRQFATSFLGINLHTEMRRDLTMLSASPQDPLCQVERQAIAKKVGDKAQEADAAKQIAALAQSDPAGLAKARAKMSSDSHSAQNARK